MSRLASPVSLASPFSYGLYGEFTAWSSRGWASSFAKYLFKASTLCTAECLWLSLLTRQGNMAVLSYYVLEVGVGC